MADADADGKSTGDAVATSSTSAVSSRPSSSRPNLGSTRSVRSSGMLGIGRGKAFVYDDKGKRSNPAIPEIKSEPLEVSEKKKHKTESDEVERHITADDDDIARDLEKQIEEKEEKGKAELAMAVGANGDVGDVSILSLTCASTSLPAPSLPVAEETKVSSTPVSDLVRVEPLATPIAAVITQLQKQSLMQSLQWPR